MLQSIINDMFSINKELNIAKTQLPCAIPMSSKCCTIKGVKNPAYKSVNSSQTIINKEIKVSN